MWPAWNLPRLRENVSGLPKKTSQGHRQCRDVLRSLPVIDVGEIRREVQRHHKSPEPIECVLDRVASSGESVKVFVLSSTSEGNRYESANHN